MHTARSAIRTSPDLSCPSGHMIRPLVSRSVVKGKHLTIVNATSYCPGTVTGYGMVKTPCQQIVWDVLPAIRAALAAELVRNGVSQQEVARLLDLAPSAVSQYISGKRGYRIVFEGTPEKLIGDLAREIREGKVQDVTVRICAICQEIRGGEGVCAAGSGTGTT